MLIEILKIIYLVAILSGVAVIGLLLKKVRGNRQSHLLCSAYVFTMLLPLYHGYILLTPQFSPLSSQLLSQLYAWFIGPMLYLYISSLTNGTIAAKIIAMHLFGAPLLFLVAHNPLTQGLVGDQLWPKALIFIIFTQIFSYAFLAYRQLNLYQIRIEAQFANLEQVDLQWMKMLLWGFIGLFTFDFLLFSLPLYPDYDKSMLLHFFFVTESAMIIVIGIFALNKPEILFDKFVTEGKSKYANSSLNQALAKELAKKVEKMFEKEELFADQEISLSSLASRLKVPNHHLSQVFSEQLGQSFYDYVNSKRVERAKQLMRKEQQEFQSLLDLAYLVGFNNKTSFNTAFKKFTKLTPSQFRENVFH